MAIIINTNTQRLNLYSANNLANANASCDS